MYSALLPAVLVLKLANHSLSWRSFAQKRLGISAAFFVWMWCDLASCLHCVFCLRNCRERSAKERRAKSTRRRKARSIRRKKAGNTETAAGVAAGTEQAGTEVGRGRQVAEIDRSCTPYCMFQRHLLRSGQGSVASEVVEGRMQQCTPSFEQQVREHSK